MSIVRPYGFELDQREMRFLLQDYLNNHRLDGGKYKVLEVIFDPKEGTFQIRAERIPIDPA